MPESKKRIFVVTGTEVPDTGKVSFSFMMKEGVPFEKFRDISQTYGWLQLRKKGDNEIDPFKAVRGEPGAVGDDGVKKWEAFVFEVGRGQVMTGSGEETPKSGVEKSLARLIEEMPSCVLLMGRDLFDRFKKACASLPVVTLGFYHYLGVLPTSQTRKA